VSTRQSRGPHLEVLPCVLSCSALGTSLLAAWSTQPLGSYLANLRIREIPGSPPPVLLGWTAQILSWLCHSRLRASNLWALTLRTSEFARSLDLRHLSSSDGRLRSSRGFATRDLEHPTFGLLPCEPPSSRDPWISTTCPPRMDGSDPLVASPLAT
jgi:hypothetical protein